MRHHNCFGAIATVLVLVLLPAVVSAQRSILVTGYLDQNVAKTGERIQLTIILTNPGPTTATDCTIETIPRSLICKPSPVQLKANEQLKVDCEITARGEGDVNVVALVSWMEDGTARATSQPIGQISISSPGWFKLNESTLLEVLAVLLVLAGIVWWFRRLLLGRHAWFAYIVVGLIITAVILIVAGLFSAASAIVLYGGVLLVLSTLLVVLGEKGTRALLARVQKAGPLEFSVAAERIQYYEVIKAKERDFKKPSFSVDTVVGAGRALDNYINLYRLEAYSLESRLISVNPPIPADGVSRLQWIGSLTGDKTAVLGSDLEALKKLYRVIEGYESFKSLFDSRIRGLLEENTNADKTERDRKLNEAVRIITQFKQDAADLDSVPTHSLVFLAFLHMLLEETETAFAIAYQAQSDFPTAIVSNSWLVSFLMEVANDSYTALGYADKALESVRAFQEAIHKWHRDCADRMKAVGNDFARHLRAKLQPYDDRIMKELQDWLGRLRRGFENNIAYAIATSELMHRETDARDYSQAAVSGDPKNIGYIDTLGLVKLTFGIANRQRDDVKDALKLFNQVSHHYARSGSKYDRKLIRLHLKRTKSALRTASYWED